MASTPTRLMTFAEFERTPDPPSGAHQELRRGEIVTLAPPKHDHYAMQLRLLYLLYHAAGNTGKVGMEWGYRPVPEYEYWEADVAFVSQARWDAIPRKGNMQGPPELVVEVLSPSNTPAEIARKKKLCLENGCIEFWVVDSDAATVEVAAGEGRMVTYRPGQHIPLFFSLGASISVDAIFG